MTNENIEIVKENKNGERLLINYCSSCGTNEGELINIYIGDASSGSIVIGLCKDCRQELKNKL